MIPMASGHSLLRYIPVADVIPRGWGVAYHATWRDGDYIAPIPLNWIIGWWMKLYWFLMRGVRKNYIDEVRRAAEADGYIRGHNAGYEAGIHHTMATLTPEEQKTVVAVAHGLSLNVNNLYLRPGRVICVDGGKNGDQVGPGSGA